MYEKEMDVVALSIFGLKEEDMEGVNDVYVYPDNWETFTVFEFMSTQWRTVSGGVTGLDYNVIPLAINALGIKKKQTPEILQGLRIMESVAISVMYENQKNNKR